MMGAPYHHHVLLDIYQRLDFKSKLNRVNYFIAASVVLESIHLLLYLVSCRRKNDFKQQLFELKLEESVLIPLFDLCFSKSWDADDNLSSLIISEEQQALNLNRVPSDTRDPRPAQNQHSKLTNLDSVRILFLKFCSSLCEADPHTKSRALFVSDLEKEKFHCYLQSFLQIPEPIRQQGWKARERFRAESKHKLQDRMFFYDAKQEPFETVILPNSTDVQLVYSRK